MQIKNMFEKDINRSINGVIKVDQSDEAVLEQELDEYVITAELRKHFHAFLITTAPPTTVRRRHRRLDLRLLRQW